MTKFLVPIELESLTNSPSNPLTGFKKVYVRDGITYALDENGNEVALERGYEEKWEEIAPTQTNGWHTVNTPYIKKKLYFNISSSTNNVFVGVRSEGSSLDRRKRVDRDSPHSMDVMTDENGDIQMFRGSILTEFRLISIENL